MLVSDHRGDLLGVDRIIISLRGKTPLSVVALDVGNSTESQNAFYLLR